MILLKRDQLNTIYLTLSESSGLCSSDFYMFKIRNKNTNNYKELILQDTSDIILRKRFNSFDIDMTDPDIVDIFNLEGVYDFKVYSYDPLEESVLGLIQMGLIYIKPDDNFTQNKQNVEYFVF